MGSFGFGCELYDVGWLELFGFEEDERIVIGGAWWMVVSESPDGLCCGSRLCFEMFFIWVCLRFDFGRLS